MRLGCGLDSRVFRIDPPPSVRWFDLDYPDVIELRRRLYPDRAACRMIGAPLTDRSWLAEIPRDRPAFVVAEGVMMYLTEDIVKSLLNRLTGHFPAGHVAFDVHTRKLVRWAQRARAGATGAGAFLRWGLDDPADVKRLEPRLSLLRELRAPQLAGYARLPWITRAQIRAIDAVPALRPMRCLLYRFS
jgi:O-methyltransferase involved in polyketide biosynthesis